MMDNPLKKLSERELVSFAEELDKYTELLHGVYSSHSDSSQGILNPYGLGLLRAIYVCVLKLYTDKKIMALKEIAQKPGFKLELGDYVVDMENFSSGVFDSQYLEEQMEGMDEYSDWFSDQVFGGILIGGDIYELSELGGIGDFIEIELPVDGAYEVHFGLEEEKSEETGAELPDFFRKFFKDVEECYENYFSEIISFTVCRSKKLGKAVEFLKKKGYDQEKIKEVPMLSCFVSAIECISEKNLFYLDSYNGSLIENEAWFGYTLTAGTCDDAKAITIYQRIPCVRGYAYLVQEIADRILDGRFQ